MALHTRADMRDDVRRLLAIVPAIDAGTGAVGDAPSYQPDPNNATIDQALNHARSALNRVVRAGAFQDYAVTVSAVPDWKRSTEWVDISTELPPGSGVYHASEIEDCCWTDADGNTNRLEPYQFYSNSKGYTQFQAYEPGTPRQFLTSGGQIGLLPPPDAAGTLRFVAASGLNSLNSDTSTWTGLPDDFLWGMVYWAACYCCLRTAQDIEAQTRFSLLWPITQQVFMQCYVWRNGYDSQAIQAVRDTLRMTPASVQAMRSQSPGGDQ